MITQSEHLYHHVNDTIQNICISIISQCNNNDVVNICPTYENLMICNTRNIHICNLCISVNTIIIHPDVNLYEIKHSPL